MAAIASNPKSQYQFNGNADLGLSSLLAPLTNNDVSEAGSQSTSEIQQPTAATIWHSMAGHLVNQLSSASYQTWLSPLRPHQWDAASASLTLMIDSQFKKDWVLKHYQSHLTGALAKVLANDVVGSPTIAILVSDAMVAQTTLLANESAESEPAHALAAVELPGQHHQVGVSGQPSHQTLHPQLRKLAYNAKPLNENYRWDSLIVSSHNQFAASAGKAVAAAPGQQFNPLCLHGATGLGKTHLMQAMAHQLEDAGYEVCYVTAEQFTNELIAAVSKKQWQPFRNRYRQVDVLLIDDVQFLGGKERTQQEFFHTLNTLVESGKQVVLSADRPPATLDMLDDRLRSRFEMGLLVEVLPPDEDARIQILREKARQAKLVLDDETFYFLAQRFTCHVRQLEGAINTIKAMVALARVTPTLDAVKRQFGLGSAGQLNQQQSAMPVINSLNLVVDAVAKAFGVTTMQLSGQQRSKQVALARQVACYLMRQTTEASHADIGRAIGGRQHSTVVHAVKKIQKAIAEGEQTVVQPLNKLLAELQNECLV